MPDHSASGTGEQSPAGRSHRMVVTGANGFIGTAVCRTLISRGHTVVGTVRRGRSVPEGAIAAEVGDLGPDTDWREALAGAEVVIHLAARVHSRDGHGSDALAEYRRCNVEGTRRLAEQAAEAGVRRFVYVSSVMVHGVVSRDRPITESDPIAPTDPYGVSKAEAEQALARLGATRLEIVVLRPPLVYGPGRQGNFPSLVAALRRGLPLPLAAIRNRRSRVFVGNLADALALCAVHPAARNETYLVRDDEDLSTPQLMRRLGQALDLPVRLFPIPPGLLAISLRAFGRPGSANRLVGSLAADDRRLRRQLGWRPPFTVDEGLAITVSEASSPQALQPVRLRS